MSLNWKEINLILQELDLEGAHIQQIFQRDFRNIYFQIYRPGKTGILRICLEQGNTRLHLSNRKPGSKGKQPRFSEFLRSRIKGGRIVSAAQLSSDRIIEFRIERGGETTLLYVKLWGNAANILACDETHKILEAAYRRPQRGEIVGGHFAAPQAGINADQITEDFEIREHPGGQSFNDFIAHEYGQREKQEKSVRLKRELERYYSMRENSLQARIRRVEKSEQNVGKADELQHQADLVLSNIWKIAPGQTSVLLEDYDNPGVEIAVSLDPSLDPAENAERLYESARKIRSRREHLSQEADQIRRQIKEITEILNELADQSTTLQRLIELKELMDEAAGSRARSEERDAAPGLEFTSGGFRLLVGRNARENDALLRRYTRGNDTWLHTRDYPGGYVFIKSRAGKSIPLEVLLDAGNLALHFSKARANGQADMYYTQVKYLRRPKTGKTGMVLPTQEKNLFIKADENRLGRLLKGPSE